MGVKRCFTPKDSTQRRDDVLYKVLAASITSSNYPCTTREKYCGGRLRQDQGGTHQLLAQSCNAQNIALWLLESWVALLLPGSCCWPQNLQAETGWQHFSPGLASLVREPACLRVVGKSLYTTARYKQVYVRLSLCQIPVAIDLVQLLELACR